MGPDLNIPQLVVPLRSEPVFVTDEDLSDLSTFFGLSKEECLQRLKTYSPKELADRWNAAKPQAREEITEFYREADLYIWDLMQWHASVGRRGYWETLAYLVEHFRPSGGYRRVLDFGCGVGTDSLFLAKCGYDLTLMDVAGPAIRFARHRFARRSRAARFMESDGRATELDGVYDIILCFDVFEHLPDPLSTAQRLVKALRRGGILVQSSMFSDDGTYPCHLGANNVRYSGLRWHINLAGLGLSNEYGKVYRKSRGSTRLLQSCRFLLWQATGLWISWVRQ